MGETGRFLWARAEGVAQADLAHEAQHLIQGADTVDVVMLGMHAVAVDEDGLDADVARPHDVAVVLVAYVDRVRRLDPRLAESRLENRA